MFLMFSEQYNTFHNENIHSKQVSCSQSINESIILFTFFQKQFFLIFLSLNKKTIWQHSQSCSVQKIRAVLMKSMILTILTILLLL
jgi:hypothetical protein